jgi:cytochrome c-type biogenesis protein CcmF
MPLLAGIPFVHSVMLQERRGMFKVWNVFLLCLTFFMTIFGTFLTRSGLIASVHSFAKSSIGIYFVVYMIALVLFCATLIIWRLPKLRAEHRIDSLLSRDFAFLLNNWILMGMLFFVLIATTWPLISEAVRNQTVTVGPGFYNKWMIPLGLILISLTGIGPLLAWRKSNASTVLRAVLVPGGASLLIFVLHIALGTTLGYPAFVKGDEIYDTLTGKVLAAIYGTAPLISTTVCTFVLVGHLQEFWRGTSLRMRNTRENFFLALFEVVTRAKRRYGGYIVHLALVSMYFGFTGSAYDEDKEAALRPGQAFEIRGFSIRYDRSRMEVDPGKRMVFTDMTVTKAGRKPDRITPAKFIYHKPQGTATTEVAIRSTLTEDVYAIMNTVNPETKVGTFRVIVRPFVAWIWLGGLMLIFGTFVSMSPSVREVLGEAQVRSRMPAGMAGAASAIVLSVFALAILFALFSSKPAHAQNDSSSTLHAGSVTMQNAEERQLFSRLLCECGDCQRLPLSSCVCSWAEDARARIRKQMAEGTSPTAIQEDYRKEHGPQSIAIPSDEGFDRLLWAVPVTLIALGAVQLVRLGRRWVRTKAALAEEAATAQAATGTAVGTAAGDRYDAALQRELDRLDDEA